MSLVAIGAIPMGRMDHGRLFPAAPSLWKWIAATCPQPCWRHTQKGCGWVAGCPCCCERSCMQRQVQTPQPGLLFTTRHHWGGGGGGGGVGVGVGGGPPPSPWTPPKNRLGQIFCPGLRPIKSFLCRLCRLYERSTPAEVGGVDPPTHPPTHPL